MPLMHHKRPMMQCYLCMLSRNCRLTIRQTGIVFEEPKVAKNRRKNHESSADRALRKGRGGGTRGGGTAEARRKPGVGKGEGGGGEPCCLENPRWIRRDVRVEAAADPWR